MLPVVKDFYSHSFDTEEDITVAWFQTKTDTVYRAYFYPLKDYLDIVKSGTILFEKGFFFGFTKVGDNEDKKEAMDSKIKNTIINIVTEFFSDVNDCVLIFHCDNGDNKKKLRNKRFDEWFANSSIENSYLKYDETVISFEIGPNGQVIEDTEYLSLIIHSGNPVIEQAVQEFQKIKDQLILNKSNGD
ncbi:hypothetical protein FW778_06230 [Ginsengibacter hankyongi]|uniref:Uncharacterized protein n=1 Tax=Ginsengibacter hankyongi TaxID=2607284 RepID=A0A5J5IKK3_9BACT|nr:DUF6169 family protein [Ginsengibacter hankyongi]KAA9041615.1 hypothetical protein FW778_06230 [Ginsengibacter hankyongi]